MKVTQILEVDQILRAASILATSRAKSNSGDRLEYRSPDENEKALFAIICEVSEREFDSDSVQHVGGHKFPDVIFPFAHAGVEIKCHKRAGEMLLGNSIMGSTLSLDEPKAIRLLVWTDSTMTISFYDYFESVVGAEVTHSPRFRLKPGADHKDRLFGEDIGQVGTIEEVCLGPGGIDAERILARMRAQALRTGSIPWWLGDAKPMAASPNLSVIRSSLLKPEIRQEIESLATILFPEVLGERSSSKYEAVIAWAITTRGVLLSRDDFSANGKVAVKFPEICEHVYVKVPRSFERGILRLSRGVEVSLEELRLYWNESQLNAGEVKEAFDERLRKVQFREVVTTFARESCPSCEKTEEEIESLIRAGLVRMLSARIVD